LGTRVEPRSQTLASNAEKVNKKPWHLEDLANGEYDPFKLNSSSLEGGSPAIISVGLNSFVVSR